MICGQNCPARFGGKTIECALSHGHDARQPHLAVVGGQNVTWFNSAPPVDPLPALEIQGGPELERRWEEARKGSALRTPTLDFDNLSLAMARP